MNKTCVKINLIFVCKYRKKLLFKTGEVAKAVFTSIAEGMDFKILVMEVDAEHIPFLLEYAPTVR